MPLIMTQSATVTCPHGGTGINIPTQFKVFVQGSPVMVEGDSGTIPDCKFPVIGGPPCVSYQLNSMKLNSSYIDGKNIILITDYVLSNTGFPLIISETHCVDDNTTPAPLKPGEKPSFPPFLLNMVKPVINITPPSFYQYSLSGSGFPIPVTTIFDFTSFSNFPHAWKLTKLFKPMVPISPDMIKDLTDTPMVTVVGGSKEGEWTENILKANAIIPPTEFSIPGKYYFTFTAIDQRGNADYVEAEVEVIT